MTTYATWALSWLSTLVCLPLKHQYKIADKSHSFLPSQPTFPFYIHFLSFLSYIRQRWPILSCSCTAPVCPLFSPWLLFLHFYWHLSSNFPIHLAQWWVIYPLIHLVASSLTLITCACGTAVHLVACLTISLSLITPLSWTTTIIIPVPTLSANSPGIIYISFTRGAPDDYMTPSFSCILKNWLQTEIISSQAIQISWLNGTTSVQACR